MAAAVSKPAGPSISFEEKFGTRWTVWVGGLALALGGIFLVRYAIEQGLVGPAMRIFLGALFAAALVAGGEWARRKENLSGVAGIAAANIPAILTAAGTVVAYATVYAAYALYQFLPPPIAFVLLGAVAVATLAAALLHGPWLAGLGVVGGFVTPMLVSAETPNYWALYIYLAVVTAAAFALARVRLWRWLAITATAFGVFWMLPGLGDPQADVFIPHLLHAVVGFVLAAVFIVSGFLFGPDGEPGEIDRVSSGTLAAYLFACFAVVVTGSHDGLSLSAFTLLAAATVWIAWKTEAAAGAVAAAAVMAVLVISDWAAVTRIEDLVLPPGALPGTRPELPQEAVTKYFALGGLYSALFGLSGFLAQGRSSKAITPLWWAGAAIFVPLAILVALYYRIGGFDRSIPFAALALLLAALFGFATELLIKRAPRPGLASAAAIFATGTIAALALALTMALEKGWLTVALSLMAPGIAYIAEKRPLPMLRWLVMAVAAVVLIRVMQEPRIVGLDVGTTPVFNWLLWGYGIPALSFWTAGYLLRRRADDFPARMTDSLAVLFSALLVFWEIRHYAYGGNLLRPSSSLVEIGLQVSAGFAACIGLERVRARTKSIVHNYAGVLIFIVTVAAALFGLLVAFNPVFTAQPVVGRFINLILLCYGLPAVLAIALAIVAKSTRPMNYRLTAAVTSVLLALAYLSLEVRTLFHGEILSRGFVSDAEGYTYSAVWLIFGVVLLLAGIWLQSKPARLASAAVVILTIGKVFLVDMAGLQGVFRALSFIGLGLVLVGIGWLYQRLLFPGGGARQPQ